MKYMGSKRRIIKEILPIILSYKEDMFSYNTWIEPFVGGANSIQHVPSNFKRIGYDINPHTIFSLIDIRDNPELLPDFVDESFYKSLIGKEPESINSWIRFNLSFGGKLDSGYARGDSRNFAKESKNNALKQSKHLQNIDFLIGSYEKIDEYTTDCIIYCDPPYKGTTSYKNEIFDYEKFYKWCKKMSKNNLVFISEYSMPDDFDCIWCKNIKSGISIEGKEFVEKLFRVKK